MAWLSARAKSLRIGRFVFCAIGAGMVSVKTKRIAGIEFSGIVKSAAGFLFSSAIQRKNSANTPCHDRPRVIRMKLSPVHELPSNGQARSNDAEGKATGPTNQRSAAARKSVPSAHCPSAVDETAFWERDDDSLYVRLLRM